jgi:hypothetical protein
MSLDLLELIIRHDTGTIYEVSLRLTQGRTSKLLVDSAHVTLEPDSLIEHQIDPDQYGNALAKHVFTDKLRHAWKNAMAYREGRAAKLRFLIHIEPSAAALQTLLWETLADPERQTPLALDEQVILSRYLESDEQIQLRAAPCKEIVHTACPHFCCGLSSAIAQLRPQLWAR